MVQQLHEKVGIRFDHAKLAARFPSYRPSENNIRDGKSVVSSEGTGEGQGTTSTVIRNVCQGQENEWWTLPLARHPRALLAIIGRKPRQPGHIMSGVDSLSYECRNPGLEVINRSSSDTTQPDSQDRASISTPEVQVHISARLRISSIGALDSVPGYVLAAPCNGRPYWRLQSQTATLKAGTIPATTRGSCPGGGSCRHERATSFSSTWSWRRRPGEVPLSARLTEAPVGALEADLLGLPHNIIWR